MDLHITSIYRSEHICTFCKQYTQIKLNFRNIMNKKVNYKLIKKKKLIIFNKIFVPYKRLIVTIMFEFKFKNFK